MAELKFTCPKCSHHTLECCMEGLYVSPLLGIDENGEFEHGGIEGYGNLDRYQCKNCGYIIESEEYDCPITDDEDLVEWLKQNCVQEEN